MTGKPTVYVDGQEGTTGLRIHEHLAGREDLEVLSIDPAQRRDTAERARLINAADLVFLCLPEAASRQAVALATNPATRIIDASTAFRTDPTWTYGLPELHARQRDKLRSATRVANPGCHASAFILALHPLRRAGILPAEVQLSAFSLTGYSGGGKKMIAQYEAPGAPPNLMAARPYALGMQHKHLPEMQRITGLDHPPLFTPVVCNVFAGLAVETFLPVAQLAKKVTPADLREVLAEHYHGEPCVRVIPLDAAAYLDGGSLDITACNGTNRVDIFVFGNEAAGQISLIARLDNLGKGASGAAVQNMNLMLGLPELAGLTL